MAGITAVVVGFVLEDGHEPAGFEIVDGFDAVDLMLADECEEFRVGFEELFEKSLTYLVRTTACRGFSLLERPVYVFD